MKNTPERREKVLQALRAGNAYSQAASAGGISRITLIAWRKADRDFDEQCHVAESEGIRTIEDVILATAKGGSFEAAKFIVERRAPTRQDYAPVSHNHPFQALQLNVLAQVAPPLMQLGSQSQTIDGEVLERVEHSTL
jgi:hypothetical protein